MKTYCISLFSVDYELELLQSELQSDLKGFYKYHMHPMTLGYEPKIMYIAPNREDYWTIEPTEGWKQIHPSEVRHFIIN